MDLVKYTQLSLGCLVVGLCCLAMDSILIAKHLSHKKWYGFLLNSVTTMLVGVVRNIELLTSQSVKNTRSVSFFPAALTCILFVCFTNAGWLWCNWL